MAKNADADAHVTDAFAARDAVRAMARQAMHPEVAAPARPPPRARRGAMPAVVAAGVAACVAALLVLYLFTRHPAGPVQLPGGLPQADAAGLLAADTPTLVVYRLAPAPLVVVMLFPSLHLQALALDRVAAFVEKAAAPRDHVLDDAALDAVIAAGHDTFDTYYYAHDYRAADLRRFFALADRDHVRLRPAELELRGVLGRAGMMTPDAPGALISLPPPSPQLDAPMRAAIFRHEASHGVYFTDPAFAAYVAHFWSYTLTQGQRAAFTRFLGDDGYDTADTDLMRNEMQAYLVHTPDARMFDAGKAGLSADQVALLRAAFVRDMPPGWLRDGDVTP